MPMLKMPPGMEREVRTAAKALGFRTEAEFVNRAVQEKLLEIRRARFAARTDVIRERLAARGASPEAVLAEFERRRHAR